MAEIKRLKPKEVEALSEIERKNYYKALIDSLKLEEKQINREIAERAKKQEVENRKRINHAKYLVAGELLASGYAVTFLKELAAKSRFTKRHTDDLNLLMESLGYSEMIRFIPMKEEEKGKMAEKSETYGKNAQMEDERA